MSTSSEFLRVLRPYLRKNGLWFIQPAVPLIYRELTEEQRPVLLATCYKVDKRTSRLIKDIMDSTPATLHDAINLKKPADGTGGPDVLTEAVDDAAETLEGIIEDWYATGPTQLPPPILLLFISYRVQNFAAFPALNKMYQDCAQKNREVEGLLGRWFGSYGNLDLTSPPHKPNTLTRLFRRTAN